MGRGGGLQAVVTQRIPTYPLDVFSDEEPPTGETSRAVHMLKQRTATAASFGRPYRSDYYGVGICFKGEAVVSADLERLTLAPQCVLAMPPQTVKQWHSMSADFEHLVIFFTQAFITERNAIDPDRFACFESGHHLMQLAAGPAASVAATLRQLHERFVTPHPYTVLLFDVEAGGAAPPTPRHPENRGRQLTTKFKGLVKRHFARERQVSYYARALSVTPRHLSAMVRERTGKTAGDWIQETVVLEARVLLHDASLTIGQVADAMHFPDPSSFGKFFKKVAGVSPLAYRRGTAPHPTF